MIVPGPFGTVGIPLTPAFGRRSPSPLPPPSSDTQAPAGGQDQANPEPGIAVGSRCIGDRRAGRRFGGGLRFRGAGLGRGGGRLRAAGGADHRQRACIQHRHFLAVGVGVPPGNPDFRQGHVAGLDGHQSDGLAQAALQPILAGLGVPLWLVGVGTQARGYLVRQRRQGFRRQSVGPKHQGAGQVVPGMHLGSGRQPAFLQGQVAGRQPGVTGKAVRHRLDRYGEKLLAVPEETQGPFGRACLALEANGGQLQFAGLLREHGIAPFHHPVANAVSVPGVFPLLAQRLDHRIGVLRLRELTANQVSREEQFDGEHQLFLDVHLGFVRRQLNETVPRPGALVCRRPRHHLDIDGLGRGALEGQGRNGQGAGAGGGQLVGPGDFPHHVAVDGLDAVTLVAGEDLEVRFDLFNVGGGQVRKVEIEQIAQVDVDFHAALDGEGQHFPFVQPGPVRLDAQFVGLDGRGQHQPQEGQEGDGPFYHGVSPSSGGV